MTSETLPTVRAYLARVRTALADLPTDEIEDISEDVRPHLARIAEELGADLRLETLIEQLGTPESYAAELRTAGDYPPPPQGGEQSRREPRLGARLALWSMVLGAAALGIIGIAAATHLESEPMQAALLVITPVLLAGGLFISRRGTDRLAMLPEMRWLTAWFETAPGPARRYLQTLTPALWPLCTAVLGLLMVTLLLRDNDGYIALPVLIAAGVLAMWAGPKSATDRRMWWASVPVVALAAGSAIGLAGFLVSSAESSQYPVAYNTSTPVRNTVNGKPQLYYGEHRLTNLYVFSSDGAPLTDVYIYTENGRPILVPRKECEGPYVTRDGRDNKFPRPHVETSRRPGGPMICREIDGVPFTVAIPKSTSPLPTDSSEATEPADPSAPPTTKRNQPQQSDQADADQSTKSAEPTPAG